MHAQNSVRRGCETSEATLEETESSDLGCGQERSQQASSCWHHLSNFRQQVGEPGASGSKEDWNNSGEELKGGVGAYKSAEQLESLHRL